MSPLLAPDPAEPPSLLEADSELIAALNTWLNRTPPPSFYKDVQAAARAWLAAATEEQQ